MKVKILMAVGLLLSNAPLCKASETKTEYYANLAGVISPLLEYNPRGKTTSEAATGTSHYRVKRDAEGRLLSIGYFEGSRPSNDAYFRAHEVRYSYADGQRVRQYFAIDGEPMAMWRHYYQSQNVHREVYSSNGGKTVLQMYGLDGERVAVGTGSYEFVAEYGDPRGFVQTQSKEDGTANVIFDYLPFERSIITKSPHGYLFQILQVNNQNEVISHADTGFSEMRLHFDEYGNELGWDFRNPDGVLVNRASTAVDPGYASWLYKFDWIDRSKGRYRHFVESYQTAEGEAFCIGVRCSQKYVVTQLGKISALEIYGKDGALVMDPDQNYAKLEISYDEQGRRTEMRFYGADDKLRTSGTARRTYIYTDDGQGPAVQEYDHTGALISAPD